MRSPRPDLGDGDGRRSRASRCARGRAGPHQRIDVLLQQRLTAGDLDYWHPMASTSATHHRRDLASLVEGVRRVAPRAAEIAGGQADEHARPARMGDSPWIEWKISVMVSIFPVDCSNHYCSWRRLGVSVARRG